MTSTYKVLGQASPASLTNTPLYMVPGGGQTVASSIVVSNRDSAKTKFRVMVCPYDPANIPFTVFDKNYIYYDLVIDGNDTFIATIGIALNSLDQVLVYSSNGKLSFSLFGLEII